ncbi:hypothetical protein ANCCAN_30216 [Ancylostoma caninum]|uniref:Uncharacterized protein n=1 Tax=Ancylostoma caninum TaxID=29170 RepID=A0A368EWJ3_ANCCA|nr:hypothetical protein ANCCAN_30216 [Ancylostoma caninum]
MLEIGYQPEYIMRLAPVNWFTLPLLVYAMLTRAQKRARHEDGPATPSVHTRAKKRVRHVSKKSPKLEISPPVEQANQASNLPAMYEPLCAKTSSSRVYGDHRIVQV